MGALYFTHAATTATKKQPGSVGLNGQAKRKVKWKDLDESTRGAKQQASPYQHRQPIEENAMNDEIRNLEYSLAKQA